ncbi:NUDIX domain protein [Actibacterium lipolyticum]|uniref:NUDIX domain protein n=2 Tax=Actibacterium lipolyticum TaxID=1524263 RepID=A0A238JQ95_9RHOB|nr:NUDIX domain protein [Actibacterium lipolyticum]
MIRVKALGLHWRNGRLLASEVYDDAGKLKGVRPLGGSVEFGEPAHVAVLREFKEELGLDVVIRGQPLVMENLYAHEGSAGHEVLFIFEVTFPAGAFDGQERVEFYEDSGAACVAHWYDLNDLDRDDGPELFPAGLKALLINPSCQQP